MSSSTFSPTTTTTTTTTANIPSSSDQITELQCCLQSFHNPNNDNDYDDDTITIQKQIEFIQSLSKWNEELESQFTTSSSSSSLDEKNEEQIKQIGRRNEQTSIVTFTSLPVEKNKYGDVSSYQEIVTQRKEDMEQLA
eukprot:7933786-Ditylum_brightwellii.AAC.1